MTTTTDRVITALRSTHQDLAATVNSMSNVKLAATSGAAPWTVAQVLSHLGSGAVITLATIEAATTGQTAPGSGFNQSTWDHWDALDPQAQADNLVLEDGRLISVLESLKESERETLRIPQDHLGPPMPLAGYAGMRLNEVVQHAWDIHTVLDPEATISSSTAALLAELFATDLQFLLQFAGHADALEHPTVIDIKNSDYTLTIGTTVKLTLAKPPASAAFNGPLEAFIRLIAGRLRPSETRRRTYVTGNTTLDDLQTVFPGY